MITSPMNIALTINHTYVPYAYTMLLSLLEHHSTNLHVYIIYHELKKEDFDILSALSVSYHVKFFFLDIPEELYTTVTTIASPTAPVETYFRLILPEILPDYLDRILYLDADLIINSPIDELYFMDFAGRKLACVQTPCGTLSSGVLLFNLPLFRNAPAFSHSCTGTTCNKFNVHTLLSILIDVQEILPIDERIYNLTTNTAFSQYGICYETLEASTCILHYAGEKPWNGDHLHNDLELFWWNYAEKSPYYPALLEQAMQGIVLGTSVQNYISNIQKEHRQLKTIVEQYETLLQKLSLHPPK